MGFEQKDGGGICFKGFKPFLVLQPDLQQAGRRGGGARPSSVSFQTQFFPEPEQFLPSFFKLGFS